MLELFYHETKTVESNQLQTYECYHMNRATNLIIKVQNGEGYYIVAILFGRTYAFVTGLMNIGSDIFGTIVMLLIANIVACISKKTKHQ